MLSQTITLNSGSTFTAPTSWSIQKFENHVQLNGPEKDLTVSFLELPMAHQNLEEIATSAWKIVQPAFDLKPINILSPPATGLWEQISQVPFDTPSSDTHFVIALVRTFKERAYVCLLEGTKAMMSRRNAEFKIMFETFKPVGFEETEVVVHEAKDWTEVEKEAFETFILDAMRKLKVPGVAIAIVRQDGKAVFSKGFGVKHHGLSEAVSVDTPFMIGSTTKALTSYLMAMMIDQKKLSWETPVTDILKDFTLGDLELTQKLTIRHTVSASTGMPAGGLACLFKYSGVEPEDRLDQMKHMHPTTKIGETFQYSNDMLMMGGYAASRAHTPDGSLQQAYACAMKDFVFDPLQMKKSVIKMEDAMQLGAAFPHGLDFNGELCKVGLNIEKIVYNLAPAGAVWSTVEDLSQYLLTEMNKGLLHGKRIISEECILERRKPGIRIGEKSSYGLGLFLSNEQALDIVGHGGNTMGFSSDCYFLPEKGIGMAVLTNRSFANDFLSAVKQKFLELSFGVKLRSDEMLNFAVRQQQESVKINHTTISLIPTSIAWIETLVGEYSSDKLGEATLGRIPMGDGYEMVFNDWKSRVGSEEDKNGNKFLVLIDPPAYSNIKLKVQADGIHLVLAIGQERECFVRKPEKKEEPYSEILYAKKLKDSRTQELTRTPIVELDDKLKLKNKK